MSGFIRNGEAETHRGHDLADWVVIGSGAAGAVVAHVLSEAGQEVIVVEEGPMVSREELRRDMFGSFGRMWRDAGFQVARGRCFLPILQGRAVGGSTIINGAIVHRIPAPILDQWHRDHGAGELFGVEALERTYDRLDALMQVAPAPDEVLGGNNLLMKRGVEALGLRGNLIRRNVVGCKGSARCLQGCPTAQKLSTNYLFVPKAVEAGARVYASARVEHIEVVHGRAAGVTGHFVRADNGRGQAFNFGARKGVIVAASAIQTPVLLQRNGIGTRSGLLGRRFQCHPGASLLGIFHEPVKIWFGATQGYESTHYWDERMKFESVGVPLEVGAARLPGFGSRLLQRLGQYGHIAQWGVQIRAEGQGRVRRDLLGNTRITWDYTDADVARMKLGLVRIGEMMFAAGAHTILPGIHGMPEEVHSMDEVRKILDLPNDPRLFHSIASHLFGTAVMGESETSSVVAPDGRVHGLQGLWVADSSIFPSNMGVNPAHTISALAWLIAERALGG